MTEQQSLQAKAFQFLFVVSRSRGKFFRVGRDDTRRRNQVKQFNGASTCLLSPHTLRLRQVPQSALYAGTRLNSSTEHQHACFLRTPFG